MTVQEFIADIRERRKAGGSLRVVQLKLPTGGDYFTEDIVNQAIAELEDRMLKTAAGMGDLINPPTALEKLGIELLKESI